LEWNYQRPVRLEVSGWLEQPPAERPALGGGQATDACRGRLQAGQAGRRRFEKNALV